VTLSVQHGVEWSNWVKWTWPIWLNASEFDQKDRHNLKKKHQTGCRGFRWGFETIASQFHATNIAAFVCSLWNISYNEASHHDVCVRGRGAKLQLHAFLTYTLDRGELSDLCPICVTSRERASGTKRIEYCLVCRCPSVGAGEETDPYCHRIWNPWLFVD